MYKNINIEGIFNIMVTPESTNIMVTDFGDRVSFVTPSNLRMIIVVYRNSHR